MSGGSKSIFGGSRAYQHIILFGLIISIPGFQSTLLGLIYFFIPLVVLFYLYKWEYGFRYIVAGITLAAIGAGIFNSFGTLFFTATFIPPGYVLAQSAFQADSPVKSGLKATLTLLGCWLLLLAGLTMMTGVNPVTDFMSLNRPWSRRCSFILQTKQFCRFRDNCADRTVFLSDESNLSENNGIHYKRICHAYHLVHHGCRKQHHQENHRLQAMD